MLNFRISKSQKKILKCMTKFLKNRLTNDNSGGTNEDQQDNKDISNEEALNYPKHLTKAQKDKSPIDVSSIDDEVCGRLSINSVKMETQKKLTSALSSDQAQLTNSNSKNTLEVRSRMWYLARRPNLLCIQHKKNKLLAQGKSQSEIELIIKEKKQQNYVKKEMEELFEEVYTRVKKLEVIQYQH